MSRGAAVKTKSKAGAAPKPAPAPLYPIRFKEIYKAKIWGGPELKKTLGKAGAPPKCGESWELAQRGEDTSVVAAGPHKGLTLTDLMQRWPREVLGNDHSMRFSTRFPLLVKFLCAHDRLSLQVHPSDDYAQSYGSEPHGKMEAWYVISSAKTGRVTRGVLPGTTLAEFKQHLAKGTVDQCLNVMEVRPGDIIFLPPGTIHSAGGGVVFLEVQQNSDITYRLTDWGRTDSKGKGRSLEPERALSITDFYSMGVSKYKAARIPGIPYKRSLIIKCEKFVMESIEFDRKRIKLKSSPARFEIVTCVRGQGRFCFGEKLRTSTSFKRGETYLLPAHLGEYEIAGSGSGELVVTYID